MLIWKLSCYFNVIIWLIVYSLIFIIIPMYEVKNVMNFILTF
ncbi:hypothetical protein LCDVSa071L [Lymphocystis disease virus 3]|uniref:Uncharacterized protein n=1 Tax=Lymphocystis disease virus 3 TaxID=2560566 RepID=A0A1B2RVY3_9VIRU|nr:hypothetical protein BZK12_gp071 [Lymphocystis disease virus Sa]AOC55155.1 hypothetical protein LCDVSa071L [Lymphocystis disease virus 3]